ncbi:GAF domain-containing protein [Desulfovibrio litoralis]|uniref:GAF domain-containing protein n=1 Tax=Desulfovibrio litoralis DSM 11393 TaxID=1121455 RepID=A0A1M7TFY1_9BACT|nr:GAF domain-containing protein [Desulfovibrio litoralis]SHN69652.1 GAF domain-containing protein [Desulfovibrio litoralis DSM 11393]
MKYGVYEQILGILCSVLEGYSAVIFLPSIDASGVPIFNRDSTENEFSINAWFSLGDSIDCTSRVKTGNGLVGWIVRSQEPLLIQNYDRRKNSLGYYLRNADQSIKAFMGCPLKGGIGALCLDSKRQYSFSEKDQKILQLFSELISDIYIQNNNQGRYQEDASYYLALSKILQLRGNVTSWEEHISKILSYTLEATGFSYASFCVTDSAQERYFIECEVPKLVSDSNNSLEFPINMGLVGWVFRNNNPVHHGGLESAPAAPMYGKGTSAYFQSLILLPVTYHKKVQAVFCLASPNHLDITEKMKNFAGMVADQLGLILENIFLKVLLKNNQRQL